MSALSGSITALLQSMREDDREAFDRLLPLVYPELRRIAHRELRRVGGARTLNTTALVHEAYLRLVDQSRAEWQDRFHFFAVSSRAMRQILVDQARRRGAAKRGGGGPPLPLDEGLAQAAGRPAEFLALDEALSRLGLVSDRLAQVVELRFFGGLSVEEIAQALGRDERTVRRDWEKARAILHESLAAGGAG
jgi:RNA polymerase sigma factor (TIGR02999 family)